MDKTAALVGLWLVGLGCIAVPVTFFVMTARSRTRRLQFQARQIQSPVRTWFMIISNLLVALAAIALGVYGTQHGYDVWFGVPFVLGMLVLSAHQVWIWFLPVPTAEEFVETM